MENQASLSTNWTEADIADYQRTLVDKQLAAMHAGDAPPHFEVVGTMINWLRAHSGADLLTLLDAGCASAYYYEIIEHYAPNFVSYTGMDFSPRMLELAEEYYPNVIVFQQDLRTTGHIEANSYEVVMSGAALMHIREWRSALRELARIAEKWLLLHRTWLLTEPGPTTMEIGEAYGHCAWYITFERAEIRDILLEEGFVQLHSLHSGESAGEGKNVRTILFERQPRG